MTMSQLQCIWDAKAELGEGALWHDTEQALYWVDILSSQLHRYKPGTGNDAEKTSWQIPGSSISSVVPCSEGGLLATFADGVKHLDLETGEHRSVIELETDLPDNRFNDGCCDTQGNYWFGSMDNHERANSGRFYRLRSGASSPAAGLKQLEKLGQICITNGPTFSADGQWLYFTDTLAQRIFRAPLSSNCEIGGIELFVQFTQAQGYPDGMCTDTEGYLWVCHFAGAQISRFAPDGTLVREIPMPVPNITKCAFGGSSLNTLFITTASKGLSTEEKAQFPQAGGLFAVELEQQGFCFPAVSINT